MGLTNKTLSQFVKTTQNNKKEKTEKFVYGKISDYKDNTYYVRLDGSEIDTPVSNFTSSINTEQRVIVMIKNHEAVVTGNVAAPAASTKYVDDKVREQTASVDISDIEALWKDYFN